MAFTVTIVVGNPKPKSRTLKVAETLVEKILAPGSYELEVIDLAEHTDEIFAWPSDEMAALNARVASSDLALAAACFVALTVWQAPAWAVVLAGAAGGIVLSLVAAAA